VTFARLLVLVVVSGCVTPVAPEAPPYEGALPPADAPLDVLTHRLARIRERMRARGYEELPRQARTFALEGHAVVLPLDLPAEGCSTFVALGSTAIRDLALTLFDGEGETLASEDVPGEGGLVHVCPQTEHAVMAAYLVVTAREGGGSVALTEFRSEPGVGDGFEQLFEDVLAPREPFADVEDLLARSRTALRARGLTPLVTPSITSVAEGGSVRSTAQMRAGRCYVIVARAAPSVHDADLFLFDPAGVEVDRDIGRGSEPSIEHCPEASGSYAIEARAFAGRGALGLMVAEGAGRELEPIPPGAVLVRDELDEVEDPSLLLEVMVASLSPLGFEPPIFVTRSTPIVPGEARLHELIVGPGCALLVATGSSDSMDVDLYLADAAGHDLDSDTAIRSSAIVRACYGEPTVARVAVKAYGREGSYALAILRAPASIDDVVALRLAEAGAPFRARGYVSREAFEVDLEEGARSVHVLSVPAGRCVAMIAAGAGGLRDVDLQVLDAAGNALASDSAPQPFASASACAPEDASLTLSLEVVAYAGAGRASIAILDDAP
jgi:hypothetical protein